MVAILRLVFLFLVVASCKSTYIFTGNPFTSTGVFNTSQFAVDPLASSVGAVVYTPNASTLDSFPVIWFVGGYDGFVPGWGYSNMLQTLAAHGFITVAITDIRCTDMVSPVPFLTSARAWSHIAWLKDNLDTLLVNQTGITTVKSNWSSLTLMCHSGGCEITTEMNVYVNASSHLISANINMGPYFNSDAGYDQLLANHTTPTLSFATELAEQGYPSCSFPFFDYAALFYQWPSAAPKMMFSVPGRGHCDIYDNDRWYGCSPYVSNWCATNVSCSFLLSPTQYCNLTVNGGAKKYANQSASCNATSAAHKPCWARYNESTVWTYTMYYAASQSASQEYSTCYNSTSVCREWDTHIQLSARSRYRRFSAGVVMAFMTRFALGWTGAESWLTTAFPPGMTNVYRNFGT